MQPMKGALRSGLACAAAVFATLAQADPAARMAGGVLVNASDAGDVAGDNFKTVWHVIK